MDKKIIELFQDRIYHTIRDVEEAPHPEVPSSDSSSTIDDDESKALTTLESSRSRYTLCFPDTDIFTDENAISKYFAPKKGLDFAENVAEVERVVSEFQPDLDVKALAIKPPSALAAPLTWVRFVVKPSTDDFSDLESFDELNHKFPVNGRRLVISEFRGNKDKSLMDYLIDEARMEDIICTEFSPLVDLIPHCRLDSNLPVMALRNFLIEQQTIYDDVIVFIEKEHFDFWGERLMA